MYVCMFACMCVCIIKFSVMKQLLSWALIPRNEIMCSQKNICILLFIATLFLIAKEWKQLQCSILLENLNKMYM